jgi:hypothetical protein
MKGIRCIIITCRFFMWSPMIHQHYTGSSTSRQRAMHQSVRLCGEMTGIRALRVIFCAIAPTL